MKKQRTRIKLCGLRTAEQAVLARNLDVDFIGLVFAERSRRHVTVEEARQVVAALGTRQTPARQAIHPQIPTAGWFERCAVGLDELLERGKPLMVGVFVDQPPSLVNAIADMVPLDVVQFSGQEPWEQSLQIHRPVIKSMHVEPETSAAELARHCEVGTAALCMLDTGGTGQAGGSGRSFDWSVATDLAAQLPIMLAGGLDSTNVAEAIARVHPWAVDVSSGIETDGMKDEAKMRAFVNAVRSADAALVR